MNKNKKNNVSNIIALAVWLYDIFSVKEFEFGYAVLYRARLCGGMCAGGICTCNFNNG
ncbi:hypothetical protein [Lachnobacterium bovis]|uniref:hypothetical protein n=1 Tax=Lachnobacterium bovis TaxID=140626 RepID=UPI0018659E65|nr:hypothetical protein [Lachnobacterium bovis]